jgi:CBS domain-containing protein
VVTGRGESWRKLEPEHRVAFAREFKTARSAAVRDAEAFHELLFALERLGSFRTNSRGDLSDYRKALGEIARESHLAFDSAARYPESHLSFSALYEAVRAGRNDAMHQGVPARHLSRNAQEIALIIEDALMSAAKTAKEFMVREPVCAELWQPISAIRRTMLLNAFTYLPYEKSRGAWRLIADRNLVEFLRESERDRKDRLLMTLGEALDKGLEDTPPCFCEFGDPVSMFASKMNGVPCLVLSKSRRLVGIVTEFDLL